MKPLKVPEYLKKGDTIGIVCPSGYMPTQNTITCTRVLKEWGYKVVIGKTVGSQFHYFSGTDLERLSDLQEMLDNPEIKAILCARGGYGMSRIIDELNFYRFSKKPKWLIGFSDITVLHAHVNRNLGIVTLHAPMAAAFNDGEDSNEFIQSLRKALKGIKSSYHCLPHPLNRMGTATGELIGGNLSIIAHLIGSRSAYLTEGKILFLEDVGEYIYNIDRMLIQLKRAGLLQSLAGLIVGGFTEMKDTTIPFGTDILSAIHYHTEPYDYPVCFDFPVSHEKNNYALKIGATHQLMVASKKVQLKELL